MKKILFLTLIPIITFSTNFSFSQDTTNKVLLSNCKSELLDLFERLQSYSKYDSTILTLDKDINSILDPQGCSNMKPMLELKLKRYEGYDNQLTTFDTQQKGLKAKVTCIKCPTDALNSFLVACQNSNP